MNGGYNTRHSTTSNNSGDRYKSTQASRPPQTPSSNQNWNQSTNYNQMSSYQNTYSAPPPPPPPQQAQYTQPPPPLPPQNLMTQQTQYTAGYQQGYANYQAAPQAAATTTPQSYVYNTTTQ